MKNIEKMRISALPIYLMKQGRTVIAFCCSLLLFGCAFLSCNRASETSLEKPSESSEEISYLSNIPTYTPPIVVPSEPLHIDTSHTSFQWIRSVGPDLEMDVRAQPQNASLFFSDSSLYTRTTSSVLKTNDLGDKEWSLGYWREHEMDTLGGGILDGIAYNYFQCTPEGNIVVAGIANTNELSSSQAWQSTVQSTVGRGIHKAFDGFLACYSPQGERLWSTYIGGSDYEGIYSLSVHNDGIYLIGWSDSQDFYDRIASDGIKELFLMKFSFSGEMLWAKTYLPQNNDTIGYTYIEAVQNTKTGFVVLCTTDNDSLPLMKKNEHTLQNRLTKKEGQGSRFTFAEDYYILYIDLEGNISWSTYLGGSSVEYLGTTLETPNHNIPKIVSDEDTFCIVGETTSLDYPLKNPLQDRVYSGEKPLSEVWLHTGRPPGCPVITCFSFSGEMLWSTYFGGPPLELTDACMKNGQVYLSGIIQEPVLPMVSSEMIFDGYHKEADGILAQIDSNGTLLWSTYFGGDNWDSIDAFTIENDTIYFSGTTGSTVFQSEHESSKSDSLEHELDESFSALYVASIQPNSPNCIVRTVEVEKNILTSNSVSLPSSTSGELMQKPFRITKQAYDILKLNNRIYTVGVLRQRHEDDYLRFFKEYEEIPPEVKGIFFLTRWDLE